MNSIGHHPMRAPLWPQRWHERRRRSGRRGGEEHARALRAGTGFVSNESEDVKGLYSASATAAGGRGGRIRSAHGSSITNLPIRRSPSGGAATDPARLFAAGHAVCRTRTDRARECLPYSRATGATCPSTSASWPKPLDKAWAAARFTLRLLGRHRRRRFCGGRWHSSAQREGMSLVMVRVPAGSEAPLRSTFSLLMPPR